MNASCLDQKMHFSEHLWVTILPSQVLTQKQKCVNTPEPAITHITFTANKYYHTASHRPQQVISNMHHLYSQRFLPDSTSQTTARDFNHIATHRPQPGILSHSILTDHCQWFLSHGTSQSTARDLYHMAPCGPQQEIYIIYMAPHRPLPGTSTVLRL